jgi:hypothetical protein
MKKRLESELISIAHRILKLKNKSEVDQLYKETQKLYETLTVLKFYQDNFEFVKSDVTEDVLEEKLELSIQLQETDEPIVDVKTVVEEPFVEAASAVEIEEEQSEAEEEELTEEEVTVSDDHDETKEVDEILLEEEQVVDEFKSTFSPIFELEVEEEEMPETAETASEFKPEDKSIALEDFLGENYTDPVFVKPNEVALFPSDTNEENPENLEETKSTSVSETYSKSIAIGLNDRIGFVQHLFNNSNEDFNRVISQLNTFNTFEEAKSFINEMVIPDYDYWVGEEDYMERFMEIVEKKFQ